MKSRSATQPHPPALRVLLPSTSPSRSFTAAEMAIGLIIQEGPATAYQVAQKRVAADGSAFNWAVARLCRLAVDVVREQYGITEQASQKPGDQTT